MPVLSLRVAALLSCALIAAACQTPPATVAGSEIAPRLAAAPDVPLSGMATMRAAEVSPRHVRFDLADHRIAMRLPDGFCAIDSDAPATLRQALKSFDKDAFRISSLAMPCAVLKGEEQAKLPLAFSITGQVMNAGVPLVLSADTQRTFNTLVKMLHPGNGNQKQRRLVMDSFIKGVEKSGKTVEHFDAASSDGRIRGRLLMRDDKTDFAGRWIFVDLVFAPVGDRVLGVGVFNVSVQPAPPNIKDDSEQLFATLRQVRN